VPSDVEIVGRKIRRSAQRFIHWKRERRVHRFGCMVVSAVVAFEVEENDYDGLCFLCYRLMIDQEFMLSLLIDMEF
jgi:hypothetical protein